MFLKICDKAAEGIFEESATNKIQLLKSILPEGLVVNTMHVGSTSIPGIRARAAITIIIVVSSIEAVRDMIDFILKNYNQIEGH